MTNAPEIAPEQRWRADTYNLLASLLLAPPEAQVLERIRTLRVDDGDSGGQPLARAWKNLSHAAQASSAETLRREFHALFIGMTRGEIVPYASYYLTGFLMEKPLARIRDELRMLGIRRNAQMHDPEDHVAALFEVMTLLIRRDDPRQRLFFEQHIASWAPQLFKDLRIAGHAVFYAAVADLAEEFMTVEQELLQYAR